MLAAVTTLVTRLARLAGFTLTTSFFACFVSSVAPLCFYLTSDEQRLTRIPLHKAWRGVGLILALAGTGIWSTVVSSNAAAVLASATVWMTAYVVLPYISWIRQPLHRER
jgi:hypothetical protein